MKPGHQESKIAVADRKRNEGRLRFSANLGFLWTELDLPDAIHAAKSAGFSAVEFHWPYDVPVQRVVSALEATNLPLLGINTRRGDVAAGDNGLAAIPGRETEARAAILEALAYAHQTNAEAVHVMAGFAKGHDAHNTFVDNLKWAAQHPDAQNLTLLIEPLNPIDAPGYFLNRTEQALEVIQGVNAPNLKMMFDCYHVGRTEGDVTTKLTNLLPHIGHIQFASVPDRGRPDQGELDYSHIFSVIQKLGWSRPLGAEYKPDQPTESTLSWLNAHIS